MFSLFEWYYLASIGYPIASLIRALLKIPHYDARIITEEGSATGVEIFGTRFSTRSPYYVGSNNVMIPVGGGTEKDWESIGSSITIDKSKKLYHWVLPDIPDIPKFKTDTTYMNDVDTLRPFLEKHELTNKIPITFPLKVDHYKIPGPKTFIGDSFITNNRQELVRRMAFKNRLPLSITVPMVGLCAYVFVWFNYNGRYKSMYGGFDAPPTDIIGKITGNTAEKAWKEAQKQQQLQQDARRWRY